MKKHVKKIVMLGDPQAGKTSLTKRFVDNSFNEQYLRTIGVNIMKKNLTLHTEEEHLVALMIWDVEGTSGSKALEARYIKGANGLVIVVDQNNQESIKTLRAHLETADKTGLPYIVALNKSDLPSLIDSKMIADTIPPERCIDIVNTSAKTDEQVDILFTSLTRKMLTSSI